MKTIKINFIGTFPNFEPQISMVYKILKKHYDVQIADDPDYLICDIFGDNPYSYCGKPQVRILENGENYVPDFNLVDYAVSRYPIQLFDRNYYLPGCVFPIGHWSSLPDKNRNYTHQIMEEKIYFANFIAGHESENGIRGDFFKELCKYKRVESIGSYLNNMPDGQTVLWYNDSKTDFQRKCKFTLCFESTSHLGFVTEKITDAFYADTIPVYYGDPEIKKIFNEKAFINCGDYPSFEAVIEKIKELDEDDEKYLEMLRQPILVDPDYTHRVFEELERFVCNIVEQPLDQAYRRSRVYSPMHIDNYLANVKVPWRMTVTKVLNQLKDSLYFKLKKILGRK